MGSKEGIRKGERKEERIIYAKTYKHSRLKINSFICQIFIEISLCIRHFSRHMDLEVNKIDKILASWSLHSSWREEDSIVCKTEIRA